MDGPGRPSHYKPEFAEQAFELCLAGATNRDLAETFEVGHSTIDNWLHKHPEFAQAVRRGRALADGKVAHGLYARAIGYSYETTRVVLYKGEPVAVPQRCTSRPTSGPPSSGCATASPGGGATPGRCAKKERQAPSRRAVHRPGRAWPSQTAALVPIGKAMRAWLRARPRRMMAEARAAVIRKGMGKGALAVMRLTTKPGQIDADADAVLLQHVADALAPDADGGLAGIVRRRVGQADEARERGDDGDLAALARDHAADQRLDGVEHAADIDRHRLADAAEIVERGIGLVDRDAGIGDQRSTGWASSKRGEPGGERLRGRPRRPCRRRPWRPWRGTPRRRP